MVTEYHLLIYYKPFYIFHNTLYFNSLNYEFVEAVRYLDVNPVLPEDTSEAVKKSHSEILSSLLLNSALAAHKLGGSGNARTAIDWTSRAINRLELSNAEKGQTFLKKNLLI